jgi:hypothetical protein
VIEDPVQEGRMDVRRMVLLLAAISAILCPPLSAQQQCGGVERWPVKVGSDSRAGEVGVSNRVPITLHDLVNLPRPQLPSDDNTRLDEERTVYSIQGRLLKFKPETGKTGDRDYHLVITDDTLQFTPGGASSTPSLHSFIAEIVRPECVPGRNGDPSTQSRFQAQLATVLAAFEQHFPNITGGWNDAGGIPVQIAGVGFFDRPHGQTGRALNGIEIHPILDISLGETSPAAPASLLQNEGFESGAQDWVTSAAVITNDTAEPARTGNWKAWLGGYGTPHTDTIYQQVSIPASAASASLSFYLHVSTEEQGSQDFDTLRVQVRSATGQFRKTLATYSNRHAAGGFQVKVLDLMDYRGQTIRIHFEGREDNGSLTSFVLDDIALVIE